MKYVKSLFYMIVALISMASTVNAQHIRSEGATKTISPPILNSPANGSTGISLNPTLTWNATAGAISYELQVSADSTFATTIYDKLDLTDLSKSILGLSLRTKYYWRVNASAGLGTSSWSNVWSFNTIDQLSWSQVNNGLKGTTGTNSIILSLAVNSSGEILAGAGGDGAYLSTNDGTNWTAIDYGLTNTEVHSLVVDSAGSIFAGTANGIYESTNNGSSWTQVGLGGMDVLSLAINLSGYIFAGTNGNGVCRSMDGGDNWASVFFGLKNYNVFPVAISPSGYILAGTGDGTYDGVYLSTDNGETWTTVHNGMPNDNVNSLATNSSGYIFAGTNSSGIFLSTNNGSSWTPANNGLTNNSVWPIVIHSSGYMFAGTDGGGVYLSSNNGANWSQQNDGLTEGVISSLAISPAGYIFAGTYGGGIYRASISFLYATPTTPILAIPLNGSSELPLNPTLSWNASPGASHYELQVSVDSTFATITHDVIGFTDTAQSISGLLRQTGYYWRVNAYNPGGTSSWSPAWRFTTCPFDLISVKDVPFDQGGKVELIWQASMLDTNVNTLPYYSIWRSLSHASERNLKLKTSPTKLEAGLPQEKIRTLKTDVGTFAWEWIGNQPAHRDSLYSYIAPTLYDSMPGTKGIEYFVISAQTNDPNIFFDSNVDSGYSVDNLPPLAPVDLTASVVSGDVVLRWARNVEPDLKDYIIFRLDSSNAILKTMNPYDTTTETMYTDTHPLSGKVDEYLIRAEDIHGNVSNVSNLVSIVVTNVKSSSAEIPDVYGLGQNFPNPFNPTTTIKYQLPANGLVRLKVFDILGREVASLVSEQQNAGYYTVILNAASLSSGVYYYRIQAGTFSATKKLLLLK